MKLDGASPGVVTTALIAMQLTPLHFPHYRRDLCTAPSNCTSGCSILNGVVSSWELVTALSAPFSHPFNLKKIGEMIANVTVWK